MTHRPQTLMAQAGSPFDPALRLPLSSAAGNGEGSNAPSILGPRVVGFAPGAGWPRDSLHAAQAAATPPAAGAHPCLAQQQQLQQQQQPQSLSRRSSGLSELLEQWGEQQEWLALCAAAGGDQPARYEDLEAQRGMEAGAHTVPQQQWGRPEWVLQQQQQQEWGMGAAWQQQAQPQQQQGEHTVPAAAPEALEAALQQGSTVSVERPGVAPAAAGPPVPWSGSRGGQPLRLSPSRDIPR